MATKKDLIEAQGFSRRRLLTAFTSGAPGGKELEPAQPLRAVAVGVGLAVVVVIAGLFYGLIRPGLPAGWENNRLILLTDTGARYVSVEGTLHPVLNTTSARLLIPAGEYKVITTDKQAIEGVPIGGSVGILGAPDDLPAPGSLLGSGWAACAVDGGTAVDIAPTSAARVADGATVIDRDGDLFVVSGGLRFAVDDDSRDSVLRAVGLDDVTVVEGEGRLLNLFTPGADFAPLVVPGAGDTLAGTDLVIGTVVHPEGAPADERYVVTAAGELAGLSPLGYQLYLLGTGDDLGPEQAVGPAELADIPTADERAGGADWPQQPLVALPADATPCATLTPDGTVLGTATDAAALPAGGEVRVAVGSGALAGTSGSGASGPVHLIDETGTAYAIEDGADDPLARLGYAREDVVPVTGDWLQFFAAGPDLTIAAAGSSPGPTPDAALASFAECTPGTEVFSLETPPALALLDSPAVWQRATGAGILVAVVDSGIDASNDHLAGAVVDGVDFVGDGAGAFSDPAGHGTAIAGQIAARQIDGSGVVGLAPDAELLAVRVYRGVDDESVRNGWAPTPDRIAAGIVWAADRGADVINVSLSDTADQPVVRDAVAYATSSGALVVASAGNRASTTDDADTPRYPAAYPEALAVTAANEFGAVTDDSIHGPHVELAAPGAQVLTATTGGGDCVYGADAPGSSWATGYASAAAALVAQAHPAETPAEWAYRLMATAVRADPDARDDVSGWGLVQPLAAIDLLPDAGIRGPESPFTGSAGAPVSPLEVQLVTSEGPGPFELTRETAVLTAIAGATLLGAVGTIGMLRVRRTRAVAAAAASGGLLGPRVPTD